MASIVKRKNKYSVVYTYQDEKGEKRQKWETFATNAEAKKRKAEVEFQQESGTLVIPEAKTVRELLEDYTSIYGVNTWAMSTYEARRSLIFNYIIQPELNVNIAFSHRLSLSNSFCISAIRLPTAYTTGIVTPLPACL